MTLIAPTLQSFFADRLVRQLDASPRTIESYRDTLRLLLCFAQDHTGKAPSALEWDDLDEPLIGAFLEHLEIARDNSARTRNATSHDPESSSAIVDGPPDRTTSIRSRSPSRSTGGSRNPASHRTFISNCRSGSDSTRYPTPASAHARPVACT